MTTFNNWLKLNHQFKDIRKPMKIGKYDVTLCYDEEKRHYRVEMEKIGNVGRSQLSAELAIEDAKTSLGVN